MLFSVRDFDLLRLLRWCRYSLLSDLKSLLKGKRQALVFAGKSYGDILAELEHAEESETGRMVTYGEAYRQLRLPAHLLLHNSKH